MTDKLNNICMLCVQKNDTYDLMILEQAKRNIMININPDKLNRNGLLHVCRREGIFEHYSIKCKYGIHCSKLNSKEHIIQKILDELCMFLVAYIHKKPSNGDFLESIQWARGKYPKIFSNAYRYYKIYLSVKNE